jgi:hypothetical protein
MSQTKPSPGEKILRYAQYELDKEHIYLDPIRQLISKDLSEPYSIYVYRYFLNQWGDLCYMVRFSVDYSMAFNALLTDI